MTNLLTNGIGGTVGDTLATCKPLYTKSTVYYVSSVIGNDSFAGTDRERPKATYASAYAAAVANDIIVLLSGHAETMTSLQTISKTLTIVGEGTIAGKPGASFQMNTASNLDMFAISATSVQFRNVYFKTNLQPNSAATVVVLETDAAFIGCYWELSSKDAAGLSLSFDASNATRALIKNCTFISTATVSSAVPTYGLFSNTALSDIEIQGCVFDAGTVGFGTGAVVLGQTTRLRADGISLLHGADVNINSSSTGWFNPQTVTGGSTVTW